ncbi:Bgt-20333 [Blumeria graminis f. sp. tritici]|uniref:Bgt-20333 n=2 Tax=Blumeria graminis f. sp. tritici TaxID=62690 RepID=A0A381L1L0_BLUGR|nr:Bgt-20333 [Blumeria graminis f. sp. tritici]
MKVGEIITSGQSDAKGRKNIGRSEILNFCEEFYRSKSMENCILAHQLEKKLNYDKLSKITYPNPPKL